MFEVVEQARQVADEHRGDFLPRRQPAAGDLGEPVAEELPCRAFVAILPKTPEGFFQLIRPLQLDTLR